MDRATLGRRHAPHPPHALAIDVPAFNIAAGPEGGPSEARNKFYVLFDNYDNCHLPKVALSTSCSKFLEKLLFSRKLPT